MRIGAVIAVAGCVVWIPIIGMWYVLEAQQTLSAHNTRLLTEVSELQYKLTHQRAVARVRAASVVSHQPPIWSRRAASRATPACPPLKPVNVPEPVAAAASEIVLGSAVGNRARVTVLTDATLRIEYAPTGSAFDDRASFAVVNRRLPTPTYTVTTERCTLLPESPQQCVVVTTSLLRLEYAIDASNAQDVLHDMVHDTNGSWRSLFNITDALSKNNLAVRIQVGDKRREIWWPDKPNPGQLPGTVRTLDNSRGNSNLLQCDHYDPTGVTLLVYIPTNNSAHYCWCTFV